MVALEILIRVGTHKRYEFLHTFQLFSRPDRRVRECLGHRLFEEVKEPNRFLWHEDWSNFRELEAHLRTEGFRELLGAIEVLGYMDEMRIVEIKDVPDPKIFTQWEKSSGALSSEKENERR